MPLRGRPGHLVEAADRSANGMRHRWQASRCSCWQGQSRTRTHARCSRSHIRSGFGELGQVAGAAGDDVVQQQRLAGRAVMPATGSLIAAMSMWSGLPPICSCRPSSSAAARLGIANWSPMRDRLRQPDHRALGRQGPGQRDVADVLVGGLAVAAPGAVLLGPVGAGVPVEHAAALADAEQRGRLLFPAICAAGAVAPARPMFTQRMTIRRRYLVPKS